MVTIWRCRGRAEFCRMLPLLPGGVRWRLQGECGLSFLRPPTAVGPGVWVALPSAANPRPCGGCASPPLSGSPEDLAPVLVRDASLCCLHTVCPASQTRCASRTEGWLTLLDPSVSLLGAFVPLCGFLRWLSRREIRGLATKESGSREFQVGRGEFGDLEKHPRYYTFV